MTLAFEDANSKLADVVTVADEDLVAHQSHQNSHVTWTLSQGLVNHQPEQILPSPPYIYILKMMFGFAVKV